MLRSALSKMQCATEVHYWIGKKITQSLHVSGYIKSIYSDQRAPICSMTYGINTAGATP